MKKFFFMDCRTVMDFVYESEKDNPLPLLTRMRIGIHLFFCSNCSVELRNLRHLEEIMSTDFLPPSPAFEETIMERLCINADAGDKTSSAAGFSFRGWVIIGFFVLLSLSSSFFGMDFVQIADSEGLSFLLPVGLTIGMILSCYGALFIGSHLKELATRLRLH
jgi:hypothetical protein